MNYAQHDRAEAQTSAYEKFKEQEIQRIYDLIIKGEDVSYTDEFQHHNKWVEKLTELAMSGREFEAGILVRDTFKAYANSQAELRFSEQLRQQREAA